MDLGLHDRVAIITGAARGIGLAHAHTLAAEGAVLVLNDLDAAALAATVATLRAQGVVVESIAGDAADAETARRGVALALERFGRVDVLVNNAGIGVKPAALVDELPLAAWQTMLHTHLDSSFVWSQAVLPPMRQGKWGRIVNTSSMNFTGGGRPGVAHYAAAKAGIVGLTQTLAKEAGPHGITVNAVAPGYVDTELIAQFTTEMRSLLCRQNPVGRLCRADEVAALVAWLCSVHAGFVNGELICIDGGRRDYVWN